MNLVQIPLQLSLEKLIEGLLTFDPETRDRLSVINGKTIAVRLTTPSLSVNLSIVDGRVFCLSPNESPADTTITGSLADLLSLQNSNDALYKREVTIEGDLGVGQQLKDLIAKVDPNWQDALSPILGGTLVHQLDTKSNAFFEWISRSRSALRESARDYIHEESDVFVAKRHIANFCDDVDDLKDTAERLDARVARMEQRIKSLGEDA